MKYNQNAFLLLYIHISVLDRHSISAISASLHAQILSLVCLHAALHRTALVCHLSASFFFHHHSLSLVPLLVPPLMHPHPFEQVPFTTTMPYFLNCFRLILHASEQCSAIHDSSASRSISRPRLRSLLS